MAFPLLAALIIAQAAGAGMSAVGSSIANRGNREDQERENERDRALNMAELGFNESMADPFRQQMAQAGDLSRLDAMERSTFSPVEVGQDGYRPTFSGGASYQKSPELLNAIAMLKNSVMSGRTAPAFSTHPGAWNPSVLDLNAMSRGGAEQSPYGGAMPVYGKPAQLRENTAIRRYGQPGDYGQAPPLEGDPNGNRRR
jgi:hypothetical protein